MKRKLELPQPPLPAGKHPQKDERKELPNACVVHYKPGLYSDDEARNVFVELQKLPWQKHKLRFSDGKLVDESCFTHYEGDDQALTYAFTGSHRIPAPWTPCVLGVRAVVEKAWPHLPASYFNTCFLNRYPSGDTALGAHTDQDIKRYGRSTAMVSVSFGCARDFQLWRTDGSQTLTYSLGDGAALLMSGFVQQFFKHAVPKSADAGERISLTFRHHIGTKAP